MVEKTMTDDFMQTKEQVPCTTVYFKYLNYV